MSAKFVPRQRKHKVLARSKASGKHLEPSADSNATEHVPIPKSERQEIQESKKRKLREELPAVSGKKRKRLDKYIESKLKKDENVELIKKLADSRVDTSLYSSSKKLGQGKVSKRDLLSQALRDHQAGIDVDGKNEELLFEKRTIQHDGSAILPEPAVIPSIPEKSQAVEPLPAIAIGSGLKRPLETDDSGKPVLQKRQKRGGVKSKVSLQRPVDEEPAWEGFDSGSEEQDSSDVESGSEDSDVQEDLEGEDNEASESQSGSDDGDSEGSSEEEEN